MSNDDFNGSWIGQYTFGDLYPDGLRDTSVLFSIEMTVTGGDLKGNCFDNDHPFDEPATINGNLENGLINFVKRYPHAWAVDAAGQPVMLPDEPSHEVHYSGEWKDGMFSGHWAIMMNMEENMVEFAGAGTWTMQRA